MSRRGEDERKLVRRACLAEEKKGVVVVVCIKTLVTRLERSVLGGEGKIVPLSMKECGRP